MPQRPGSNKSRILAKATGMGIPFDNQLELQDYFRIQEFAIQL
jgi:hypothetical protein